MGRPRLLRPEELLVDTPGRLQFVNWPKYVPKMKDEKGRKYIPLVVFNPLDSILDGSPPARLLWWELLRLGGASRRKGWIVRGEGEKGLGETVTPRYLSMKLNLPLEEIVLPGLRENMQEKRINWFMDSTDSEELFQNTPKEAEKLFQNIPKYSENDPQNPPVEQPLPSEESKNEPKQAAKIFQNTPEYSSKDIPEYSRIFQNTPVNPKKTLSENTQVDDDVQESSEKMKMKGRDSTDVCQNENILTPQRLVEIWNSLCPKLPKIVELSESRKLKIRTRLKEHSETSWWQDVFQRINNSSFLCGENDKNWKATFDWFMENDKRVLRVMEGVYDDRTVGNAKEDYSEYRDPCIYDQ